MKIWHYVWIGHTEAVRRKHCQGKLSDEAFAEAAGATEADLESQIPHAHDHAKPTNSDGSDSLCRIIPMERQFDLVPCFPACNGFFSVK